MVMVPSCVTSSVRNLLWRLQQKISRKGSDRYVKSTVIILKMRTPEQFAVSTLKVEQGAFTIE